jgi:hypothetical protein
MAGQLGLRAFEQPVPLLHDAQSQLAAFRLEGLIRTC